MSDDLKPVELAIVDTTTQEWGGFPIPQLGVELPAMPLIDDPDTGMQVFKIRYQAGWTNPWHTHPCAHGIYILEGSLSTHQGTFGPGSFVWFPEAASWSTVPRRRVTAPSCSSPTSPSTSTTSTRRRPPSPAP